MQMEPPTEDTEVVEQNTDDEETLTLVQRIGLFFQIHWKGVVLVLVPIIFICILLPPPTENYQWCGYVLILMAFYWVTECIPLAITSFLPVAVFPAVAIMTTNEVAKCYFNDTIAMFLGSLIMAASVEQSGLHLRIALGTIQLIGYSHYKLLFAVCFVTMFISMWITNTAATTMMIPIVFALMQVFEENGLLSIYRTETDGEIFAEPLTVCYFCAATFSASVGGIGTLVGTATNLVFKGLFQEAYPEAPEYLSFPMYSAFAVPYMLAMETSVYLCLLVQYLGYLRPKSEAAARAKITPEGVEAAKAAVKERWDNLGKITFYEILVAILFCGAMVSFFCRSPQIFPGWGDRVIELFNISNKKFVADSTCAMFVVVLMFLLPSNLSFFDNIRAKTIGDLPKTPVPSLLDWNLVNTGLPWSFAFLLGGGFALSTAAKPQYTDLNGKIGIFLRNLKDAHNYVIILLIIIFTVFVTNFASNVAVCNVIAPIAMQLAIEVNQNPLWYNIAAGVSASYCFCLPVGTPGNLIVQGAAHISTTAMIIAGLLPTLAIIIVTWVAIVFWAPVIWPSLYSKPYWANQTVYY